MLDLDAAKDGVAWLPNGDPPGPDVSVDGNGVDATDLVTLVVEEFSNGAGIFFNSFFFIALAFVGGSVTLVPELDSDDNALPIFLGPGKDPKGDDCDADDVEATLAALPEDPNVDGGEDDDKGLSCCFFVKEVNGDDTLSPALDLNSGFDDTPTAILLAPVEDSNGDDDAGDILSSLFDGDEAAPVLCVPPTVVEDPKGCDENGGFLSSFFDSDDLANGVEAAPLLDLVEDPNGDDEGFFSSVSFVRVEKGDDLDLSSDLDDDDPVLKEVLADSNGDVWVLEDTSLVLVLPVKDDPEELNDIGPVTIELDFGDD